MALARIVHQPSSGPLYGGLTWLPCANGRPSRRALRQAREPLLASHSVLVRNAHTAFYGLTTDDDDGIARRARSAAAQFAIRLAPSVPDAALVLRMRQDEEGTARSESAGTLYFAVLVERGVPMGEVIGSEDRVRSLLAGFSGTVFTDSPAFGAVNASWEWLADPPAPAARLRRIPGNPWHAVVAVFTFAGLAGSWMGWQSHQAQQERESALAIARDADPLPRYLTALQQQRQRALTNRDQWRSLLRDLMALPLHVAGWQLQAIDCVPAEGLCRATWLRRGGTYRELKTAMPRHEWDPLSDQSLQLDQATTAWRANVDRAPLADDTPTYDEFAREAGSVFQVWRTASLNVDARSPSLWPVVAGVPASITHAQAIRRGEISVGQIPAPYVAEVIAIAPPTVTWTRLRVDVALDAHTRTITAASGASSASAGQARSLMASLEGSFYVR